MRSPFSFISISARVVMLVMFAFQLGDLATPKLAVRQLGMGNRQVRLPHGLGSVAHDVEIERARRSEERRVGKEWRARWSRWHWKRHGREQRRTGMLAQ